MRFRPPQRPTGLATTRVPRGQGGVSVPCISDLTDAAVCEARGVRQSVMSVRYSTPGPRDDRWLLGHPSAGLQGVTTSTTDCGSSLLCSIHDMPPAWPKRDTCRRTVALRFQLSPDVLGVLADVPHWVQHRRQPQVEVAPWPSVSGAVIGSLALGARRRGGNLAAIRGGVAPVSATGLGVGSTWPVLPVPVEQPASNIDSATNRPQVMRGDMSAVPLGSANPDDRSHGAHGLIRREPEV